VDSANLVLGIVATSATVVATWFAWLQIRGRRPKEIVRVADKIRIYIGRENVVQAFAEMLEDAPDGGHVYGQCRSCTDFPDAFYRCILEAAGRGVRFRFIVSPGPDGDAFTGHVRGVSTMMVKRKEIQHSRVFGVEGKEAVYVVSAPNGYVGIRVLDPTAAKHQQAAFETEWA
jgi:hypothetical protein